MAMAMAMAMATSSVETDGFEAVTAPFRRELLAHYSCEHNTHLPRLEEPAPAVARNVFLGACWLDGRPDWSLAGSGAHHLLDASSANTAKLQW
jgi:hypothetical protein